jgi:hypothetical protein
LNPRFVEMLMGLPVGWTGCDPLATGSFPLWRRLHSDRSWQLMFALPDIGGAAVAYQPEPRKDKL